MDWIPDQGDADPQILFHSQQIDFQLNQEAKHQKWIETIFANEQKKYSEINFIFCDDAYLLDKNQTYLQHDTYTDIITFEYSQAPISGDIFISIKRVRENATERNLSFAAELYRVMAHGILHLCGYGDKKDEEIKVMRAKEEACILLLKDIT